LLQLLPKKYRTTASRNILHNQNCDLVANLPITASSGFMDFEAIFLLHTSTITKGAEALGIAEE
jgi:hypothetical protein